MAKNEKTLVTMQDGRSVGFGARQQCVKTIIRDADGYATHVRYDFRNGKTLALELAKLDVKVQNELCAHGAKQKVGDEGARETVVTADDFYRAASNMVDRLLRGEWRGEVDRDSDLAKAIAELKGQTVAEITTWLKTQSSAARAALRVHPPVKAILDRMAADRADGEINAEDLLDGIGKPDEGDGEPDGDTEPHTEPQE